MFTLSSMQCPKECIFFSGERPLFHHKILWKHSNFENHFLCYLSEQGRTLYVAKPTWTKCIYFIATASNFIRYRCIWNGALFKSFQINSISEILAESKSIIMCNDFLECFRMFCVGSVWSKCISKETLINLWR